MPDGSLRGVYHMAAAPVAKYELLKLVGRQYGRDTRIVPDERVAIARSLDASRFAQATGYVAPDWPELVKRMHVFG